MEKIVHIIGISARREDSTGNWTKRPGKQGEMVIIQEAFYYC